MNYTVSIVEDEHILREELAFQLSHLGYTVKAFETAAQFYRYLATQAQTIGVLDIGLSDEDGLSICRYLREHDSRIGIVFVTARGMRADRISGLEAGADAYLVKPIDVQELSLILTRLSQRFIDNKAPAPVLRSALASESHRVADAWQLASERMMLVAPNGQHIQVTLSELRLLRLLLEKPGSLCTNVELGAALGLHPDELDKHRIEVILSRLRIKVLRLTGLTLPIRTHRSVGYQLDIGLAQNSPCAIVPT
ncbi:response regulator transcription factor [Undibacterium sp. Ren11W]|uniref:response regulator transcription factor n=1 Tax=Undibacterium sp. Ren11W TaxID=3413045 RepID=UPI003BF414B3